MVRIKIHTKRNITFTFEGFFDLFDLLVFIAVRSFSAVSDFLSSISFDAVTFVSVSGDS